MHSKLHKQTVIRLFIQQIIITRIIILKTVIVAPLAIIHTRIQITYNLDLNILEKTITIIMKMKIMEVLVQDQIV